LLRLEREIEILIRLSKKEDNKLLSLTQLTNFSQYFRYFRDSMCDSVILRGI